MAGVKIVGRVAVRVFPDTSEFPEDLRRKLDAMKDPEVPVKAKLDPDDMMRELRVALAKLQARASRNPVKVKAEVDEKEFGDSVENSLKQATQGAQRELDELAPPKLFDELRKVQVFDPSSIKQYQSRIDQIQRSVRAVAKLEEQRERAIKKALADNAELEKRRAAAAKAQADALEKENRERQRLHDLDVRMNRQRIKDQRAFEQGLRNTDRQLTTMIDRLSKAGRYDLAKELENQRLKMDVDLTPDMSKAAQEDFLHKVRKLADEAEDEVDDIKANIDPEVSEAFYRRAQQRLAWLARTRIVTLVPTVSKAGAAAVATALAALSGARLSGDIVKNLRDLFKNVDKNLPKIALMATGFLNLASSILSTSANLFALSTSLAQIGPIALALPGLFAGMALGLVALIRPLMDTNKELPELQKQWKATGKEMSKNFWAKAKEPWQDMIRTIFPDFRRGMAETSSEMGELAGTFGKLFADRNVGGPMNRMFADLSESIRIAESGAAGMVEVITILGERGAALLPRLSNYFVDITNRFAQFLTKADETGELDQWIDTAIERMKELGRVIYEAGRILGGLGKAAELAGGTTLAKLGETLKDIADVVNGDAFQQQLVDVFIAAEKAMSKISDTAGPAVYELFKTLANTFETILPVAGEFAGVMLRDVAKALSQTAVQRGLIDLFDGLLKALKLVSPAFDHMGVALGEMMSLIGELAVAFAPLLRVALVTLSNVFIELAPAIGEVAKALGAGLLDVFKALAPVLIEVAKAMAPVLVTLGKNLGKVLTDNAPLIAEFADVLGYALVEGLKLLAQYLPQIVDELLPQLLEVAKQIVPQLPDLAEGFLEVVKAIVETDLITKIGELAGELIELISSDALPQLVIYLPQLAGSISSLAGSLERLLSYGGETGAIGFFFSSMLAGAQVALFAFDSVVLGAEMLITGLLAIFSPAGRDIMNGLGQGILEYVSLPFAAIRKVAEEIIKIFKAILGINSPSTVFITIGQNIVQGLTQGIGSLVGSARTKATELANAIKTVFSAAVGWLRGPGSSFVTGLITGIGARIGDAKGKAESLRNAVKDVFNNASGLLKSAGENIAQGLANGIERGISWVTSAARSIANAAVRAAKAALDEHSPSRVFHGIGEFVSLGLANGILDEKSSVISAVETLADAMKSVDMAVEPSVGDLDYSSRELKPAARNIFTGDDPAEGSADGGAPIQFNINNYNPVAEPTSVTTTRTLREAQSLGVTGR